MFYGYLARVTLTSLALCTLVAASPSTAERRSCSELRRLYAPRILRVLRERLLMEYAEAHERRARRLIDAIRRHETLDPSELSSTIRFTPQENDDPRLKHLLAYVASNCL